ncbi:MAG: hypothetical protein ACKVP3_21550 [Hyphomicrobiaceae bacterium]
MHSLTDPDNFRAEFGLFVRRDVAGTKLERLLLEKLIRYLRDQGTREARGEFPANNVALTALAHSLGFRSEPTAEPDRTWQRLDLRETLDAKMRRGNGVCK